MKPVYYVIFNDGYTIEYFSLEEAKSLPNVNMIIEAKHSKVNPNDDMAVVYSCSKENNNCYVPEVLDVE